MKFWSGWFLEFHLKRVQQEFCTQNSCARNDYIESFMQCCNAVYDGCEHVYVGHSRKQGFQSLYTDWGVVLNMLSKWLIYFSAHACKI